MKKTITRLNISTPEKHELPTHAIWGITFLIPTLVAITNWLMVEVDVRLVGFKFDSFWALMESHGLLPSTLALVGICAALAGVAAAIVYFVAPICAGSGIPEAKGYLNGNRIPGMFQKVNFLVRTVGIIFATASGFPIGREGPMVCIGGCLGIAVVDVLAKPYMQVWVKMDAGADVAALIVYEERFAAARRIGCVLGAAAGIACAFNAPVGAILYMFEEVTVTSWPSELTFRCFVCTVAASFVSRFLLYMAGTDVHRLLIYEEGYHGDRDWDWVDIPFFIILSVAVGLLSVIFTKVLVAVWSFRRRMLPKVKDLPYFKIFEVIFYATVCAIVLALIPMLADCLPSFSAAHHEDVASGASHASSASSATGIDDEHSGHHRRLSDEEGHGLFYAQYTCPAGYYNEVATLLLSTAEGAVKHLFSRNAEALSLGALALTLGTYFVLACGMPGLSVPMGMFVPNLLIGGLLGRFAGEAVVTHVGSTAHAGVYAMVGSAAMLGGFTHMTLAIVVLLIEASNDLSIVAPLVLGTFVSQIISTSINHHGYDEMLIMRKGVPFLDADTVHHMEAASSILAADLCKKMPTPEEVCLPPEASAERVKAALARQEVDDFPVVEGSVCLGLVSRHCLEAAVEACSEANFVGAYLSNETKSDMAPVGRRRENTVVLSTIASQRTRSRSATDVSNVSDTDAGPVSEATSGDKFSGDQMDIPVRRIMDATPHLLLEDMPLTRFYPLYTVAGAQAACVVSTGGKFRGVLSRAHLIAETSQHGHHDWSSQQEDSDLPPLVRHDSSRVTLTQPRTHRLPGRIIWGITVAIAVLVGFINFCMVMVDANMVTWKFAMMQTAMIEGGLAKATVVFVGICAGLAFCAACLVSFIAPICAGSGIPEAKGYINGNYVHDMFEPPNFIVRVLGIVMATAAGFPIGREGPMICIGGCLGIGVVHVMALRHVHSELRISSQEGGGSLQLFLEEERFRHAKRIGCVLGGAAGISTAFGAPIGAILYMIEEVTVTSWPLELTVRAFVCSGISVLVSRGLLNLIGTDVHRLLIYESSFQGLKTWDWIDVPFFLLVSALGGLCSALLTRAYVFSWTRRKQRERRLEPWQPWAKIADAVAYAGLCALVFVAVPSLLRCMEEHHGEVASSSSPSASEPAGHHRLLSEEGHGLTNVRYTCPEGYHNEAATLLLSGAEGAVKHLYSRGVETLHLGALLLAIASYLPLAAGMPGLPVPMGAFVPSMLTGALIGRSVGEALSGSIGVAHAGIYAMVGSAAMLGGFTHMTLAIVVLLVEASHDLSLVSPLMLAVFVARIVSKYINHHGYDEIMVLKKGVAFLDAKCPGDMADASAGDICSRVPKPARLSLRATGEEVQAALEQDGVLYFPVFKAGKCVGLVTRARLEEVVQARRIRARDASRPHAAAARRRSHTDESQDYYMGAEATSSSNRSNFQATSLHGGDHAGARSDSSFRAVLYGKSRDLAETEDHVPIEQIMDPAPYTLLDETLVVRLYPVFTKGGAPAACILTRHGEFVGILSRANLLSAASSAHCARSPSLRSEPKSCSGEEEEDDDSIDMEVIDVDGIKLQIRGREAESNAAPDSPRRPRLPRDTSSLSFPGVSRFFCSCFPGLSPESKLNPQ